MVGMVLLDLRIFIQRESMVTILVNENVRVFVSDNRNIYRISSGNRIALDKKRVRSFFFGVSAP